MLLSLVLNDDIEDDSLTAMYQIGEFIVQIKQRPSEGHIEHQEEKEVEEERRQRALQASTSGQDQAAADAAQAEIYKSKVPNVGLLIWSSSFVFAEYLLRVKPVGSWQGKRVLELGAGTGMLGIALAMAGADVTMTDLAHITPLTVENIGKNVTGIKGQCSAVSYKWGEPRGELQVPDVLVATEVLYEPAYYKDLLDAVDALTGPTTPVYFCYKNRNLNEGSFAEHAQQRGFALEVISDEQFQEEYRDGSYKAFWMKRAG